MAGMEWVERREALWMTAVAACVRLKSSGVGFRVSGFGFQVSGVRFQVSGVRCQVSGLSWAHRAGGRAYVINTAAILKRRQAAALQGCSASAQDTEPKALLEPAGLRRFGIAAYAQLLFTIYS